jgi:hypothetical protein
MFGRFALTAPLFLARSSYLLAVLRLSPIFTIFHKVNSGGRFLQSPAGHQFGPSTAAYPDAPGKIGTIGT